MFALVCLIGTVSVTADSVYDIFQFKSGVVSQNETWGGKVMLLADVVVPTGTVLTILPGTWVVYNSGDTIKPRLIVKGKVETDNTVELLDIHDAKVQVILQKYTNNAVLVKPEPVNVAPLNQKLRSYTRRYAVTWAVIYSMLLVIF